MLAGGPLAFNVTVAAAPAHAEGGVAVEAFRGCARALASELLVALPAAPECLRFALDARSAGQGAPP
jgi:hypothetical protein